jgi:hypothetical protein
MVRENGAAPQSKIKVQRSNLDMPSQYGTQLTNRYRV